MSENMGEFSDAEIINDFVSESQEHLADIENEFLEIEEGGENVDLDLVNKVFRAIHSIKGAAGFFGMEAIAELSHDLENVLNEIRSLNLVPTASTVDVMLRASDQINQMLCDLEAAEDMDHSEIRAELVAILGPESSGPPLPMGVRAVEISAPVPGIGEKNLEFYKGRGQGVYQIQLRLSEFGTSDEKGFLNLVRDLCDLGEIVTWVAGVDESEDGQLREDTYFGVILSTTHSRASIAEQLGFLEERVHVLGAPAEGVPARESGAATATASPAPAGQAAAEPPVAATPAAVTRAAPPAKTAMARPAPSGAKPAAKNKGPGTPASARIRVGITQLDELINLAGELVLTRNQVLQAVDSWDKERIQSVCGKIDQVTRALQESIMQMRMQPIDNVFNKLPRVVRDIARKLGKEAELVMEGKEVELDRKIIEAISDPLTHLIRNALDHGIETPDVRRANRKPPAGKVLLRAFHRNGKVNIVISDDGRGVDPDKLRNAAVEKGLLSPEQARELTDREATDLLFMPGISTAEEVTDVSGRGVGMDVVKSNLSALGGTVEMESVLGAGSTIHIKLPLTLAILASLVVRAGDEVYALPQINIGELVRVKASALTERIHEINGREVLRLRGELLPLVHLSAALGVQSTAADPVESEDDDTVEIPQNRPLNVVVVETDQLRYGMIVDSLVDSEEIVVKPLGRHLQRCTQLAGATILGSGQVGLILDIAGIAQSQKLAAVENDAPDAVVNSDTEQVRSLDRTQLILFANIPDEIFAVHMGLIDRIERMPVEKIVKVGDVTLFQDGDRATPVVKLADCLKVAPAEEPAKYFGIVYSVYGREIALLVPILLDICESEVEFSNKLFTEEMVSGSFIYDDHTVRLVDLFKIASAAFPHWCADGRTPCPIDTGDDARSPKILLAEDSKFFREHVTRTLEDAGYDVVACEDGQVAWDTLCSGAHSFDLLLTDIEMPNMQGLELTRHVRGHDQYGDLPIIALTSLAGDAEVQAGKDAGVTEYQVKMDREMLLFSIHNLLETAPVAR